MGRGTQTLDSNPLYGPTQPRGSGAATIDDTGLIRYCVTATVVDAPEFGRKMELSPHSIAPGYRFSNTPEPQRIQFYVHSSSSIGATNQFMEACGYIQQTPTNIEVAKG